METNWCKQFYKLDYRQKKIFNNSNTAPFHKE